MYGFLWTGKDADGLKRSVKVQAENVQQARQILLQQGWTDLELMAEECSDFASRQAETTDPHQLPQPEEPDVETGWLKGRPPGFITPWFKAICETKGTIILFGAIIAVGIIRGQRLPVYLGVAGLLFAILWPMGLLIYFGLMLRYYRALNNAKVWGRWDDVLRYIEKLKGSCVTTGIGVGYFELVRNRALALAALGRLNEALTEYSQFENDPSVERWLYLSHLAGIYEQGLKFDKAVELRRAAAELKPDCTTVWIDLAYGYAHRVGKPAQARQAIETAQKLELTRLAKIYVEFLNGIICWREHKRDAAKQHLEKALRGFTPLRRLPLMEGLILLTKAYLCVVQAELGNLRQAKRLFAQVERFLVANRERELLDACQRVLAQNLAVR